MRRTMLFVLLVLLSLGLMVIPAFAAKKGKKKKKKGGEEPPPVGEIFVGNMPCYAPPDFGALSEGKRRMERQNGFQSVNKLVTGVAVGKDGAALAQYKIEDDDYDYFERAFLGRPQLLDDWLGENLKKCEAVGNNIKGTMAIPHPYGRLQFGEDLDLHFRTLIGTGCNPNVAAVVVIGIEPN